MIFSKGAMIMKAVKFILFLFFLPFIVVIGAFVGITLNTKLFYSKFVNGGNEKERQFEKLVRGMKK